MKNDRINTIFLGSYLYPYGYAATKRKQQFLDYIISKGNKTRVLITLILAQGHKLNETQGIYKDVEYQT